MGYVVRRLFAFQEVNAFAASSSVPKTRLDETEVVRHLLSTAELSRDQLPYSDEFARLKKVYETCLDRCVADSQFWQSLVRVRKRGKLARDKSRKKKVPSPTLTTEQQLELLRLLPDGIGTRDQLPYTEEFDSLHRRFSRLTRTNFDKREFWRVVSRIGKRSRKPKPIFQTAPLGGLPEDLVKFLELQNPWWAGNPAKPTQRFRRWAFGEVMHHLEKDLTPIVSLQGPRQVGKTTIQEQIIEELLKLRHVNPARIFRVQFDDVPSLGSYSQPILGLVRWFEKNVLQDSMNRFAQKGEPVYLFFDEVQNLKTWAPQVKSLVDHVAAKTLVTGSSALRIADAQDSLAGRIFPIELGPLRLSEIVGVRQFGDLPPFEPTPRIEAWVEKDFWLDLASYASKHAKVLKKAFDSFSDVGGYPVCHKPDANRAELSVLITRTVVERTLIHDLRAGPGGRRRDRGVLEETFRRVCRYAGQGVRARRIKDEVAEVLGPGVRDKSVHDAIKFLANALLVHEVPPLEALTKRQAHPSKLCLCDHFVREAWLQEQVPIAPRQLAQANEAVSTTAGHLIESDIGYYLKGIPGSDVSLSWFPARNQEPEVDFVLTLGLSRIPIEIKYRRGRPDGGGLAGLRSFCSQAKYNAPFGLLITQELSGALNEKIVALPAYALLSVR
jgi:predicted AAA+ superfamily ATPase